DDGDPRHVGEAEVHVRQRHFLLERPQVGSQRLRHDQRLLENLLLHEMTVIALLDQPARRTGLDDVALYLLIGTVVDGGAVMADRRPIALLEIGYPLRERRQSKR